MAKECDLNWKWIWIFLTLFSFHQVKANTRICTHCCDEIYPGNGTPVYYMTKGPKGDQGDMGPVGPQGIMGAQGIIGPKGDKGETGEKGAKGEKGDPAPIVPHSAFSLARSKPLLGNESSALAVSFDKVFVNTDQQFDEENNRFHCKYPGIYHFTYTVQSYLDKFVGVQLMKNNEAQVILYANAVPRRIMQSQTVILSLLNGDVVWLRQAKGSRFAIYGNSDLQITFNGFLIFPAND